MERNLQKVRNDYPLQSFTLLIQCAGLDQNVDHFTKNCSTISHICAIYKYNPKTVGRKKPVKAIKYAGVQMLSVLKVLPMCTDECVHYFHHSLLIIISPISSLLDEDDQHLVVKFCKYIFDCRKLEYSVEDIDTLKNTIFEMKKLWLKSFPPKTIEDNGNLKYSYRSPNFDSSVYYSFFQVQCIYWFQSISFRWKLNILAQFICYPVSSGTPCTNEQEIANLLQIIRTLRNLLWKQ